MKHIILPFLLIFTSFLSYAQPCVPGAVVAPLAGYIIPDSATNFAVGCAGQPYEQIIYIKAPKDTVMMFLGNPIPVDVDSFVMNATIGGLPAFLSIATMPALTLASPSNPKTNFDRLVIPGDSLACVKISGTIPAGTSGNNPLTIAVRAYLSGVPILNFIDTPANVTYYHINIMNPCWPASVNNLSKYNFDIVSAIPNPASSKTTISFVSNNYNEFQYTITNMLGEVILSEKTFSKIGINNIDIDLNNFSNGMYMFSLSNGSNLLTQKIQVNK